MYIIPPTDSPRPGEGPRMKYLATSRRLTVLSDLKAVEIFLSLTDTKSLTKTI